VQENDEPKQELLPESDMDFYSAASEDAFTFDVNAQGQVTGMTLHVDGHDILAKRIE
jgi:hypothetical protein